MMILTLEITGPQGEKLGSAARKEFRASGGTIGRLPTNDWALTDPYVSSHHAVIRYTDGVFFLEDTSMNGVFVNSQDNRLVKGRPHPLKSGDWIFIEPYEIRASIANDARDAGPSALADMFAAPAPSSPGRADARGFEDPFGQQREAPRPAILPSPPASDPYLSPTPLHSDVVDPLDLLGFAPKRPPQVVPKAADLQPKEVLRDHYRPPAPIVPIVEERVVAPPPKPSLIPDNWLDDTGPAPAPEPPRPPAPVHRVVADPPPPVHRVVADPPRPVQRPVSPPPPVQESWNEARDVQPFQPPVPTLPPSPAPGGGDLAAVLAGAGLPGVAVTPELAHNFGRILHIVVAGVMDVLQARVRLKNEFRVGVTTFRPKDNNPLKFSANVEDALHNLLVKRNTAFLGPVEAFDDAFADIRHHQIAILAGVRVAFNAMLAEFDPDRLQEVFDKQKKSVLVSKEAHYWDLYRSRIRDMVNDADATFRTLFGDEFAQAYEEQLKLLKAQGRASKG